MKVKLLKKIRKDFTLLEIYDKPKNKTFYFYRDNRLFRERFDLFSINFSTYFDNKRQAQETLLSCIRHKYYNLGSKKRINHSVVSKVC